MPQTKKADKKAGVTISGEISLASQAQERATPAAGGDDYDSDHGLSAQIHLSHSHDNTNVKLSIGTGDRVDDYIDLDLSDNDNLKSMMLKQAS